MTNYTVNVFWSHDELDMFELTRYNVSSSGKAHLCNDIEFYIVNYFSSIYAYAKREAGFRVPYVNKTVDDILDPAQGCLLAYAINNHTGEVSTLAWCITGKRGHWLGFKSHMCY